MILNRSHGFLFIKVARAASTSVQLAFEKFCGAGDVVSRYRQHIPPPPECRFIDGNPHLTLSEVARRFFRDKTRLDKYFKFCFVRNPFDRIVSRCYWMYREFRECVDGGFVGEAKKTLEAWVQHPSGDQEPSLDFSRYLRCRHASMDFIGRYENLEDDYRKACGLAGVVYEPMPHHHLGMSRFDMHYSTLYTRKARDIVSRKCKRDLEWFGYEF